MELQATWRRVIRVWWALAWRNVLVTMAAMIVSFFAGFLLGLILEAFGVPVKIIQVVSFPLGMAIGLAFSLIPIWLIFGKDFGEFRLVLMGKQVPPVQFPNFPAEAQAIK